MLDSFSVRARQIVFAARLKAGERGASLIDMDDFLVGIVLEDQGLLEQSVFSSIFEGQGRLVNEALSHIPFFSAKVADDLLAHLKNILPQSQPMALTFEIPLSSSLERVFDSAKAVQAQFQHAEIEPLHLLAAMLNTDSSEGVRFLRRFGMTRERVLSTLSGSTEN